MRIRNRLLAMFLVAFVLPCAGGCGMPSLLIKPVSNTNELEELDAQPDQPAEGGLFRGPRDKIVLIEVEGMLINARSGGGFFGPEENKLSLFTQQLDRAAADGRVKAVVLRINSPGGTVTCSDTMYQMIRKFRAATGKPVVANTQEVAASGGYYVACGASRIVAHPTSVVGSIGVIFETFEVSGTMQKLGVTSTAIKSGPLKDMGSPFKPLDAEARKVMQGMVDEYYTRFVAVVRENRKIADESTLKLCTDGRVFSGETAQKLGLVDSVGTLPDAIAEARNLANAPSARVVFYKRPYGYGGSIYAHTGMEAPASRQDGSFRLELPTSSFNRPTGFYYLWQP